MYTAATFSSDMPIYGAISYSICYSLALLVCLLITLYLNEVANYIKGQYTA